MDFSLYIQAEPEPRWSIVLQGIASAVVTAVSLGVLALAFLIGSTWTEKAGLFAVALTFAGVAGWSWYTTYNLYFRRHHYADIYLALTDTDFIYQHYDLLHRLKRVKIPRAAIFRVDHGPVPTLFAEDELGWQVCIQYRDEQGKRRKLWINYAEFFPMQEAGKLLHALSR